MNCVRHLRSLTAVLALVVAGCSGDSLTYYTVTGKVTYDSEPVKNGSIIFTPGFDPELPPVGGTIEDGKYTLKAYPGQFKVKITASRPNPAKTIKTPGGQDVLFNDQYIPAKYNEKTELTVDVDDGDPNTLDFELKK